MKRVRFKFLLASSGLGLILALAGHTVTAQQIDKVDSTIPVPDTALPPPPTAKDIPSAQAELPAPVKPAEASTAGSAATAKAQPSPALPADAAMKQDDAKQDAKQTATNPMTESAAMAPSPALSPLAEKIRDIIVDNDRLKSSVSRDADRASIVSFYKARDYAPIWIIDGQPAPRAKSAIAYLRRAHEVGLDPVDYPTPQFTSDATPEALAEAEIKLTHSALNFARHAQTGRIHFTRVAADIAFDVVAPDPADILAKLAASDDAGKVLDGYNPPHEEFKALRAKLAELRSQPQEKETAPVVRIDEGKALRRGMKDPRVIALRQRLDIPGDKNDPLYDEKVEQAVKAFQLSSGMDIDGRLGPSTVRVLNGEGDNAKPSRQRTIDTVIVNMERWRWFPRDLGNVRVIVNVPDYTLTLWDNDQVYWTTKIVAGKPANATPMISARMTHITVNPTWNVPPSIIEKEYLPALEQDPDALERIGLKLEQAPDGTVRIYQPPGARNALGRIRFNFPNKFLVYQHDTPDKHLFSRPSRAYSHGCMRVENPLTYGEKLLSLAIPEGNYTEGRLKRMYGDNERNIQLDKTIWVHLTYQTAFVDQDGNLQLRHDIYRRDARMLAILKGSERKVADTAIYRRPDTSSKPVRLPVGALDGYGGGSDGNFIDWIFGGGPQSYRPRTPGFFDGPRVIGGRYSAR